MTVWLVRAGKHGEFEQKFLQENKIFVTWDHLAVDIGKMRDRSELTDAMTRQYPDAKPNAIRNNVGQVWPFAHGMEKGDLVILPSKSQPAIYVGEITGGYEFDGRAVDPMLPFARCEVDRGCYSSEQLRSRLALFLRCVHDHLSHHQE